MIEFYGWASVWATPNQDESKEGNDLEQSVKKFTSILAQFDNEGHPNTTLIFKPQNGRYQLAVVGSANHKSITWQEVLAIFEWLAENAKGSYGKLYLQDDEDDLGFDNQFQIYVLQNGTLTAMQDENFKPIL